MSFLSALKKLKDEVSKVTLKGVKEAAEAVDKWDDIALSGLSKALPENPEVEAIKEIEPQIVEGILKTIEFLQGTGLKGPEKLDIAAQIIVKDPAIPGITKIEDAKEKIQSIFNVVKGLVKK